MTSSVMENTVLPIVFSYRALKSPHLLTSVVLHI